MTDPVLRNNYQAWNERVLQGGRHTDSIHAEHLQNPLRSLDPDGWLGDTLMGRRVLCLAAGGGLQSALAAAAGGKVTVVDISEEMLRQDARIASHYGWNIRTIQTSMDRLDPLGDAVFDVVIQPVSTCYVREVLPVYREVARVLAEGGLYISQHKTPQNLQGSLQPNPKYYQLEIPYHHSLPLPPQAVPSLHREIGCIEFLHRWESLLGSLCRSGFVIEDLVEPKHADPDAKPGTFGHRCLFLPPYVRIKARRVGAQGTSKHQKLLWTPS